LTLDGWFCRKLPISAPPAATNLGRLLPDPASFNPSPGSPPLLPFSDLDRSPHSRRSFTSLLTRSLTVQADDVGRRT